MRHEKGCAKMPRQRPCERKRVSRERKSLSSARQTAVEDRRRASGKALPSFIRFLQDEPLRRWSTFGITVEEQVASVTLGRQPKRMATAAQQVRPKRVESFSALRHLNRKPS